VELETIRLINYANHLKLLLYFTFAFSNNKIENRKKERKIRKEEMSVRIGPGSVVSQEANVSGDVTIGKG